MPSCVVIWVFSSMWPFGLTISNKDFSPSSNVCLIIQSLPPTIYPKRLFPKNPHQNPHHHNNNLKEYYEINCRWIVPSIWIFFPHMLILLQKCISNHETKQSSKFQSNPSPNGFTIDVWNIYKLLTFNSLFLTFFSFSFFNLILHKFCSVLICDILAIGLF